MIGGRSKLSCDWLTFMYVQTAKADVQASYPQPCVINYSSRLTTSATSNERSTPRSRRISSPPNLEDQLENSRGCDTTSIRGCWRVACNMELARLRTELPFPTRPWEAAKARFLDGLSQEERQKFGGATPENLFYDASASQKNHARGSRLWMMQQKVTSLVEGIADYGKALDVYANASSLVLCPIWGSVRVVLHVSAARTSLSTKAYSNRYPCSLSHNAECRQANHAADCSRSRKVSGETC
jgi:hypothetical protein